MCRINNLTIEPFSKFSAEEEKEILKDIFFYPQFYKQLLNLLKEGNSRFILGQRGQGKSAIIYRLFDDLQSQDTMPLLITKYDGIPATDNSKYFIYKIIQAITLGLSKKFFESPKLLRLLSSLQRERLNHFIEMFYDPCWAPEFMEKAKHVKMHKIKRFFVRIFNKNIDLINNIADGAVKLTSETIRKSLGFDIPVELSASSQQYFKSVNLNEFKPFKIQEVDSVEKEDLDAMLATLMGIADKIGLKSIVVLFDQVDEYPLINSNIDAVSDFMKAFLSDTNFLYTNRLGVIFTLWSEAKQSLNIKGVRFDKFQDIDIRWKDEDLEEMINHRLKFYSKNPDAPVSMDSLIVDDYTRKEILALAGKSPRSLLILLSKIFYADERDQIVSFLPSSISSGMISFCKSFDYVSLMPYKMSKREDLNKWISKVLAIKKITFTIDDYIDENQIKPKKNAITHIEELKKFGFVRDSIVPDEKGRQVYEVAEPRLRFLIARNILTIED